MALVVYNTLTRKKDEFVPIKPGRIGMYVCGITAYDSCHLGHARAAIVFDVIVRYLRYRGYDVTYVRNYTDVDDKIINRANKDGVSCKEISERYIKEYEEDMKGLGVAPPDIQPKATEHIPEMVEAVKKLIDNGLAYESNGSVYFSVRKFAGYGKLSGKNIEELEAGARVEIDETKQDPLDFALWKASKPGEPKWPSPWGEGRPGWHIECSAMSAKYLGQPFDIHGGGRDLVFPHHENEIAQAEGACGCQFVRYWLHNGFININAEKMSKSLGNIKTIGEIRQIFDPEVIRYFILSSHYRSPIDYTEENINNAERALIGFYTAFELIVIASAHPVIASPSTRQPFALSLSKGEPCSLRAGFAKQSTDHEKDLLKKIENLKAKFENSMDDDFNTASAVGAVFETMNELSGYVTRSHLKTPHPFPSPLRGEGGGEGEICAAFVDAINSISAVLGFFGSDPQDFLRRQKQFGIKRYNLDPAKVDALIAERASARKSKKFARADEIRSELGKMNIELNDRPDGTTEWFVKS